MNPRGVLRTVLIGALLLGLLALPSFVEKDSIINLVVLILLYVTLASSWNILGGYTGQTNLGHAAFFGLGSLVTRMLWTSGFPLFPSMLLGCAVAVALALIIGVPAFKLRGAYFAIGTLALGQVLFVTVGNEFPLISALPAKALASYELLPRYYFFVGMAVVTVAASYLLAHSRLGLGMMAVREQEDAAEFAGSKRHATQVDCPCDQRLFRWVGGRGLRLLSRQLLPAVSVRPRLDVRCRHDDLHRGRRNHRGSGDRRHLLRCDQGVSGAESCRTPSDRFRNALHPGRAVPARRAGRSLVEDPALVFPADTTERNRVVDNRLMLKRYNGTWPAGQRRTMRMA